MRNNFIVFLIFILIGFNGYSQVKSFRFGVKAAPNLGWISPDSDDIKKDGASMGFTWGFITDVTLTENYFLKTGFDFNYINGKVTMPYSQTMGSNTDPTPGTLSRKYNFQYIEIPLSLKMRTNPFGKTALFGCIGLGTSFNLKATSQDEFTGDDGETASNDDNSVKNEVVLVRESLIAGVGIEYFFDNSASLIVDFSYNYGLNNIYNFENIVSNEKQKGTLNYFQLNLGIMF
ncbi:MAG: porin family protein [Bacteroidales bacterium]